MTERTDIAEHIYTIMIAGILGAVSRAATDEEFMADLKRRRELREELSAPEWIPYRLRPYYNVLGWKARAAMLVGDIQYSLPINWYRWPVLKRLAHWQLHVDRKTRWEAHPDWPGVF